jgi:hypothetical protein
MPLLPSGMVFSPPPQQQQQQQPLRSSGMTIAGTGAANAVASADLLSPPTTLPPPQSTALSSALNTPVTGIGGASLSFCVAAAAAGDVKRSNWTDSFLTDSHDVRSSHPHRYRCRIAIHSPAASLITRCASFC